MVQNATLAAVFGLAALVCFSGAYYGSRLRHPDAETGLRALFILTGVWALAQAVQLLVMNETVARGLFTVSLVVGFATVFAWLYFCSAYTGNTYHRTRWFWIGTTALYSVVTTLKLTNPIHGEYFSATWVTEPQTRLIIEQSSMYWASFIVAYGLAAVGIYLLFIHFRQSDRSTGALVGLLGVMALPIIPKIASAMSPTVVPNLSYDPIGVAIFAVGVLYVVDDAFEGLEAPTRNVLFERTDIGVISIDTTGEIQEFNQQAAQFFPELGESVRTKAELRDLLGLDSFADDGQTVSIADGTADNGTRRYDVHGHTLTVGPEEFGESVFVEDITDEHRRKLQLERFERAIESIQQAVFITDREATITYVNPAFEEITGYTAEEAVGNQPSLLKSELHDETFYTELWETILAGETWTGTITNQRKSGMYYTADLEVSPITDAEGDSTHFVGIQTDITDEIQRNQQLTVLNRLLRHNLRNGMNVIKGNAGLLDERVVDETSRSYVNAIRTRAEILIEESTKAGEIQSLLSEGVSPAARYDFCSAANSIIEPFEAEYPTVAFELECTVEPELIADDRLDAVLSELISNAVRHNDRDGLMVAVRAEPRETDATGSWVEVVVADTGSGIPAHEQEIIESGRETQLEHTTGLGLWLVYWTVSLFGGRVRICQENGETQVRLQLLAATEP